MADLLTQYEPAICAVSTYLAIFGIAHVAKMAADRGLKRGTRIHTFALEFITALQMCTCVFENGVIIGDYGLLGFFIAVSLLLTAAGFTNRGYFGHILGHLEQLVAGRTHLIDFATVLLGQVLGSALALKSATFLWYFTANLSKSHTRLLGANLCAFNVQYPLNTIMCLEAVGCGLLRFFIGQFTKTTWRRRYVIPVIVTGHLTACLRFIGLAGLNPMTAYARLAMCEGLDDVHFFYVYWAAAAVGWLFGAHIQSSFDSWWSGKARKEPAVEKKKEQNKNDKKKK